MQFYIANICQYLLKKNYKPFFKMPFLILITFWISGLCLQFKKT